MITKTEIFEKIYHVHNADEAVESEWDNMIMVSTKNWNCYFAKLNKPEGLDIDEYKNVRHLEFDTADNMFAYLETEESKQKLIDWSVECDYFDVLESID